MCCRGVTTTFSSARSRPATRVPGAHCCSTVVATRASRNPQDSAVDLNEARAGGGTPILDGYERCSAAVLFLQRSVTRDALGFFLVTESRTTIAVVVTGSRWRQRPKQ